jgi:hypothetical protein
VVEVEEVALTHLSSFLKLNKVEPHNSSFAARLDNCADFEKVAVAMLDAKQKFFRLDLGFII